MLTQTQVIEPQSALLAACPRPRAVVLNSVYAVLTPEVSMSTQRTWQRPQSASAPVTPVSAAPVRVVRLGAAAIERPVIAERPAYAAAVVGEVRGDGNGFISGTGFAGKTLQDKQHLTNRRGLVTWRPPH